MNRTSLLEKVESDSTFRLHQDEIITNIIHMIRNGLDDREIAKKLGKTSGNLSELIEVARARIRIRNRFTRYDRLWMDPYSASYSTPEVSAIYRAKKLDGRVIIDIGSGSGMQSIFFSKYSRVSGIERDKDRFLMSRINAKVYESGAAFLNSDIFNINPNRLDFDTVFSDPLRGKSVNERTLEELQPNPLDIMDIFRERNPKFVFDLPPMIRQDKLNALEGELEYISLNGSIHRLTSYSQEKRIYSAVMLPDGNRFTSSRQIQYEKPGGWSDILFIPDSSLFYSGLESEYCKDMGMHLVQREKKKSIFAASDVKDNPMGEYFQVRKISDSEKIISDLKGSEYGRLFLRYESQDYYEEKRRFENYLTGTKTGYLFRIGSEFALCDRL